MSPVDSNTANITIRMSRNWRIVVNIYLEMQGLQAKIELVPINLQDRPTWYKEKVYAENKVVTF